MGMSAEPHSFRGPRPERVAAGVGTVVGALSGWASGGFAVAVPWMLTGALAGYAVGRTSHDVYLAISVTVGMLVGGIFGEQLWRALFGMEGWIARLWGGAALGLFVGASTGAILRTARGAFGGRTRDDSREG